MSTKPAPQDTPEAQNSTQEGPGFLERLAKKAKDNTAAVMLTASSAAFAPQAAQAFGLSDLQKLGDAAHVVKNMGRPEDLFKKEKPNEAPSQTQPKTIGSYADVCREIDPVNSSVADAVANEGPNANALRELGRATHPSNGQALFSAASGLSLDMSKNLKQANADKAAAFWNAASTSQADITAITSLPAQDRAEVLTEIAQQIKSRTQSMAKIASVLRKLPELAHSNYEFGNLVLGEPNDVKTKNGTLLTYLTSMDAYKEKDNRHCVHTGGNPWKPEEVKQLVDSMQNLQPADLSTIPGVGRSR